MNVHGIGSANHKRSSLCSSLPQGGESLLVEAEFSAGLAAASTGTSITTSTALATSSSLSTAATSASLTSPSPRLRGAPCRVDVLHHHHDRGLHVHVPLHGHDRHVHDRLHLVHPGQQR